MVVAVVAVVVRQNTDIFLNWLSQLFFLSLVVGAGIPGFGDRGGRGGFGDRGRGGRGGRGNVSLLSMCPCLVSFGAS